MSNRIPRWPLAVLVLAALTLLCSPPAAAQQAKEAAARKKLEQIRTDIQTLNAHRKDTNNKRETLQSQLAAQAKALSSAAAAVRKSDQALAATQAELDTLETRRRALNQHLSGQKQALADLLRAAYALGRGSDLRLLLGDQDLARMSRALAYSRYFQAHRVQRIRALTHDLADLDDVQQRIQTQQRALQATREERARRMRSLAAQRDEQRKLLQQVQAQYTSQGERLAALKQNEKDLDTLLAKLREAMRQARAKARQQVHAHGHGGVQPPTDFEPLPAGTPFAKQRGHLPWPLRGSRSDDGDGVLIAAPRGTTVHAVAAGRVVYANWLRGYGMLVIVNHGSGWMSLYGNNESVLVHVGDLVSAGAAVGTSGASGGRQGVYFELRHGKKPVPAGPWLARGH